VRGKLYSRGQKQFTNLASIEGAVAELQAALDVIYPRIEIVLDGELYVHGWSLQQMNRVVRNGNADTATLFYNIFDVDCRFKTQDAEQAPVIFNHRIEILAAVRDHIEKHSGRLRVVNTYRVNCKADLDLLFEQLLALGFEGAVIRDPTGLYEYSVNGRRSKKVLRYKPRFDADVRVLAFKQGNGKDTGAVIWVCQHQDHSFNTV